MTERLDSPRRYWDQIETLLREHVPGVEVWAYGSLTEALEESNVPILVQTHDWARLPESFHREIEREYDGVG